MRIALVGQPTSPLPLPYEGADSVGIVTWNLARELAGRAEVTVFAQRRGAEPAAARAPEGFAVRRLPFPHRAWGLAEAVLAAVDAPLTASGTAFYGHRFAAAAGREAARQGAHIVHVMSLAHFVPVIRRHHPAARIVLHFHADMAYRLAEPRFAAWVRAADHVVGCSAFVAARIAAGLGQPDAPTTGVAPNGVDPSLFAPGERRPGAGPSGDVLYLGRLSPEKGVHVLIDAMPAILARRPDATLHLRGTGAVVPRAGRAPLVPPADEDAVARFYGDTAFDRLYRRTAARRAPYYATALAALSDPVRARIVHENPLPRMAVPGALRGAAVFAFPSLWEEAFGLPILEAMACGVPVVATRGGGVGEFVEDGTTGRLVPRNNPAALAAAVADLLTDRETAARIAEAALARVVPRFTWRRAADALFDQYTALLARPRPRS